MDKIIALDIGSSAIKACAFSLEDSIRMFASNTVNIGLSSPKPGYAEHDPKDILDKTCKAIKSIFESGDIDPREIACLSICSQAQCVVLVDKDGNALTPILNSQDARAVDSFNKYFGGWPSIDGVNAFKFLNCMISSGFTPGSAKDPVFKFKWLQDNMKEAYSKAYKWLDIKDFVILHLTGAFKTTKDNAHAYTIYDSKKNNGSWCKPVCKMFKVDMDKLPEVVDSTDVIGLIDEKMSKKTGLAIGTKVIGGLIDSSAVQYGSGASKPGEVMVYWGTSGWVGTVMERLYVDLIHRMGSLVTCIDGLYHYYAVLDSAGISYRWLKEHLVADDGLLETKDTMSESEVYEHMNKILPAIEPGSGGVIYTPWITGCRAPMEASDIGGMFLNVKRNMGKKHIAKSVIEGICYHYRLLKELSVKEGRDAKTIRFVGGGAKSEQIAQVLADVTGCRVEVPENPQDCGAYGAALVGFSALSGVSIDDIAHRIVVDKSFEPIEKNRKVYDRYYKVYKKIYSKNHKILSELTAISQEVSE